jgi:CHAT domain-containing protein
MLIKLDRSSAGKKMLEAGLNDACARHMQVREARIRLVLGDLARSEGKVFEAITHLQKAAEIAKTQQLYRMLGAADSKLALLYAERENADAAIASALAGAQAARQGSDIYHLPQLLTVLAEQKITRADFRSAEVIYQKALSLIDELLVNVPTFQHKSVLVGTMSSVYRSYFEFTANQLRDPKKAFQVLEQARGRGTADFLRSVSSEGRDATFRSGISDANELVQNSLRPIHILAGGSGWHQSRELYNLLLAPIEPKWPRNRLLIIPDGCLQFLPFEALLNSDKRPLIESHVISYAPSATVDYWLKSKSSHARQTSFFFLGGVHYESDIAEENDPLAFRGPNRNGSLFGAEAAPHFTMLPGTRDEIVGLADAAGRGSRMLVDRDATEASLKSEPLSEYQVLHFATHGVVNLEFPDRSALILGDGPNSPEDGLLQAREIARLPLNADLVTISACDMAIGKPEGEAGAASIVQSFLFAGARSVVASLWRVDDNFTAFLMRRFYRHLLEGEDKASALREAKLELIHEFGPAAIPLHWAGFELFGDGRGSLTSSKGKI